MKPRTIEIFEGPRLKAHVPAFQRTRSLLFLAVIAVIIGAALAAVLIVGIGVALHGLQHVTGGGGTTGGG